MGLARIRWAFLTTSQDSRWAVKACFVLVYTFAALFSPSLPSMLGFKWTSNSKQHGLDFTKGKLKFSTLSKVEWPYFVEKIKKKKGENIARKIDRMLKGQFVTKETHLLSRELQYVLLQSCCFYTGNSYSIYIYSTWQ